MTENLKIIMYILDSGRFSKLERECKTQNDIMKFVGVLCHKVYAEVVVTGCNPELLKMASDVVDCMMNNRICQDVTSLEMAESIYQKGINP